MASPPGATVLYRLEAGGGCRALGGPCEDRLAIRLWFSGTRTVGDRWEPQTHLSDISQTLSLGCPGLEGFVGARTQGLRIGCEERAEFSDQLAGS